LSCLTNEATNKERHSRMYYNAKILPENQHEKFAFQKEWPDEQRRRRWREFEEEEIASAKHLALLEGEYMSKERRKI
jgi:hypothetical protein